MGGKLSAWIKLTKKSTTWGSNPWTSSCEVPVLLHYWLVVQSKYHLHLSYLTRQHFMLIIQTAYFSGVSTIIFYSRNSLGFWTHSMYTWESSSISIWLTNDKWSTNLLFKHVNYILVVNLKLIIFMLCQLVILLMQENDDIKKFLKQLFLILFQGKW